MSADPSPFQVLSIRRPVVRSKSSLRLVWYVADGRPRARWIVISASYAERKRRRVGEVDHFARAASTSRPF